MKRGLVVLIFVLSLSGCEYLDMLNKNKEQLSKQEEQIQDLKASLARIESEIPTIKSKQLEFGLSKMFDDFKYTAFLTPGDSGYSTIKFGMGVLTISLEDISQYANGSKIKLKFGNTLSATISGLKARLEWGSIDGNGTIIDSPLNSKDVSFTEDLKPGAWTSVSVVLDNIQPSELGFVRVKNVANDSILLQK